MPLLHAHVTCPCCLPLLYALVACPFNMPLLHAHINKWFKAATLCLLLLQASLFIIFGVCGLLVQTVLLRVMLSWFSESRVLVIGELSCALFYVCSDAGHIAYKPRVCEAVSSSDLPISALPCHAFVYKFYFMPTCISVRRCPCCSFCPALPCPSCLHLPCPALSLLPPSALPCPCPSLTGLVSSACPFFSQFALPCLVIYSATLLLSRTWQGMPCCVLVRSISSLS